MKTFKRYVAIEVRADDDLAADERLDAALSPLNTTPFVSVLATADSTDELDRYEE